MGTESYRVGGVRGDARLRRVGVPTFDTGGDSVRARRTAATAASFSAREIALTRPVFRGLRVPTSAPGPVGEVGEVGVLVLT